MQVNQNTTFTQIYNHFKPGPLTSKDIHLRGDGNTLYTHNQLVRHGKGAAALADRRQKYDEAGPLIRQAIDQQHGQGVAASVFKTLGIGDQVTLRNLRPIRNEIRNLLQQRQAKSDLSQLSGELYQDAHSVFCGGLPGLDHANQAFRQFLEDNHEQPTIEFVDAYYQLQNDPSPENLQAFVADHLNDTNMNLYDARKQETVKLLAKLGPSPSWEEIKQALDPVMGDVNESFAGDLYARFVNSY
jgi:hypothetical protein